MGKSSTPIQLPINRRAFLVASSVGFAGLRFGTPAPATPVSNGPSRSGSARSTILFFLCGGVSHVDTWDLKPNAPDEYRSHFRPIATSAPGVRLCEHLPMVSHQAHHLAIVNSLGATVGTNDHHAGYYYNLTGHVPDRTFVTQGNSRRPQPDDWPYMGTVVASRRPRHPFLPNAVTLPHKPSQLPYTRPGQFAARLGVEHDPVYVYATAERPLEFRAPALRLHDSLSGTRLQDRRSLLTAFDHARREFDLRASVQTYARHQDRAFSLLASARTGHAFDVAREPLHVRERYGQTINGMSLLAARRLVEARVPFITVFWRGRFNRQSGCRNGGGFDTHWNNFSCLQNHLLPDFDRGFSALITDLDQRGLLDTTLLMVTSEMGRKPRLGDPRSGGTSGSGRDHWTHAMSILFAGGGIRGGQHYGASDRFGGYPADRPVAPADITKTVYHAMGVSDLEARDEEGRPYNLLAEGSPILDLF